MSTLTDRYVHAVTTQLPAGQRDDIARELRATIADAVEAYPPEDVDAERQALLDLGHPTTLADGYRGGPRALIGPGVYPAWAALLKLLLAIVPVIVGGVALAVSATEGEGAGEVISAAIFAAFEAALQVAVWVTLAFAIVERVGVDPGTFAPLTPAAQWAPEDLPDPEARQVGWGEASWSVAVAAVGIALLTAVDYVVQVDGRPVQVLTDLALTWRWVVVAGLVLGVIVAAHLLIRGRWTMRSATANLVSNLLVGVPLVTLLLTDRLVTPAARPGLLPGNSIEWADLNLGVAAVIIGGILLWDTVDAFRGAARNRRG
ncbi:MAG: hypothetical protein LWW86_05435 [Micrococcales bacterium]|nr:hypothetical protein [Micrococcales bacterium]